jgi:hypothetical protein
MKRLVINGYEANFFFNEEIANCKIAIWINDNLNAFNLNAKHNCEVSLVLFNKILIRGNEDRMEIDVKYVESLL